MLHDAFTAAKASGDAQQQLHAALALRVFERGHADFLRSHAFGVFDRAEEFAHRGKFEQAALELDRAIALHPDEPDWLCRSAILRLYQGDINGYRRRCQEALRLAAQSNRTSHTKSHWPCYWYRTRQEIPTSCSKWQTSLLEQAVLSIAEHWRSPTTVRGAAPSKLIRCSNRRQRLATEVTVMRSRSSSWR